MRFCVGLSVWVCLCVSEEEEDDEGEQKSELVLQTNKRKKKKEWNCEINKILRCKATVTVYIYMATFQ